MGEWAQMRSRKASSSHGWSAYGGQALGAYYPQQDPSGSSSGSAVAPSVGLALGALGTETSGSIVLPAEKSNIVGIKPTLGLTSRCVLSITSGMEIKFQLGLHKGLRKSASTLGLFKRADPWIQVGNAPNYY